MGKIANPERFLLDIEEKLLSREKVFSY